MKSIGVILCEARENRGLTCFEVFLETRIPTRTLQALEKDDYSLFSSAVYAKSFLSQYAQFLEVDASAWLEAIGPTSYTHDPNDYHLFTDGLDSHVRDAKNHSPKNSKLFPTFIGLFISATIVYGVYRIDQFYNHKNQSAPIPNGSGNTLIDDSTPPLIQENFR